MALDLPVASAEACTLDECLAALDAHGFDPDDRASLAHAAHWLARLAANRTFLADFALGELKAGCARPGGAGYSPQVVMLGRARPSWFLRACIWPSPGDSAFRDSGAAAFGYGMPHDHNFSFVTIGYHGPGYRSDHYEVDAARVTGVPGERVPLRFVESSTLAPGRAMLYRAGRDVHCQFAPERLSVSLNLMHSAPAQQWHDQYRYDLAAGTIESILTRCTGDVLARLALALDPGNGRDLVETVAARHPAERMRWAAIAALAEHEPDSRSQSACFSASAGSATGWLAKRCTAAARAAIDDC